MILVLKWTTAPRQVSWLHWEMMERPTAVRAASEWEMLKHPVQGAAALLLGQGARGARVGCSGGEWRQPSLTQPSCSVLCAHPPALGLSGNVARGEGPLWAQRVL